MSEQLNPDPNEVSNVADMPTIMIGRTSYVRVLDSADGVKPVAGLCYDERLIPSIDPSAPLVDIASVAGIPIPPGVTVIFGPANSAKTPLLHYIMEHSQRAGTPVARELIRWGEPLPGYARAPRTLAARLLTSEAAIICLDSIKNLVGRLPGAAMSAGVSRELFPMLSDWSSYFAERGQALVTVLNISVDKAAVTEATIEGLRSNTTAIWAVNGDGSIDWQARRGSGLRRRNGSAMIEWLGEGKIKSLVSREARGATAGFGSEMVSAVDVGHISADTFSTALRRVQRSNSNS